MKSEGKSVFIAYGESREEALDTEHSADSLTPVTLSGNEMRPPQSGACRYVYVKDDCKDFSVYYDYEYLPLCPRGKFSCDDELVNKIWNISAYTLELNSREAFFDGIKRDRWIWSGDAYQS